MNQDLQLRRTDEYFLLDLVQAFISPSTEILAGPSLILGSLLTQKRHQLERVSQTIFGEPLDPTLIKNIEKSVQQLERANEEDSVVQLRYATRLNIAVFNRLAAMNHNRLEDIREFVGRHLIAVWSLLTYTIFLDYFRDDKLRQRVSYQTWDDILVTLDRTAGIRDEINNTTALSLSLGALLKGTMESTDSLNILKIQERLNLSRAELELKFAWQEPCFFKGGNLLLQSIGLVLAILINRTEDDLLQAGANLIRQGERIRIIGSEQKLNGSSWMCFF
ncbi:hypothetical protein T439DRAFT_351168 [Meredithblackwellia eburnea MCA 4105]